MLKTKSKGELVLMPAISDSISDLVAEPFYDFLVKLFQNADGYELSEKEFCELKLYTSLMLGKASDKMLEIYRLVAKNADKFASFKIVSPSVLTATPKDLQMNDFLKFKNVKKKRQIPNFSARFGVLHY